MRSEKAVDRNRPKKLYVQVLEALRDEIESGKWPAGAQLPVEDELCAKFEVSKAVVRQAIFDLVRQGYLTRHQGRGTFVCKTHPPTGVAMTLAFHELMLDPEGHFPVTVLAKTIMTPVDEIEEKLGRDAGQHVIYIRRLVSMEEGPLLLAESFVPYKACPNLLHEELDGRFITDILEKTYEIPVTRIQIFLDVTRAREDEAALLGINKGETVVLLEQHFYSRDAQVMYMRIVKRADRGKFSREFEKR